MRKSYRILSVLAALLLASAVPGAPAEGQDAAASAARSGTRTDLEARAVELDQLAASPAYSERTRSRALSQSAAIRARLVTGDFRAGDQIILVIEGQLPLDDTLTVLDGSRLQVPNYRTISLSGVLRSELETKLRTEITDIVKNSTVSVRPLIRLAVFGAVAAPGYLSVPSETTLDDLIMRAGGPTATAEIDKLRLVRADTVLARASAIRSAVAEGRTVGALDLTDGDALFVPESGAPWDRGAVLQTAGFVLTLLTIFVLRR